MHIIERDTLCFGPMTHEGCGAICPAYQRGCYGNFGPMETPNTEVFSAWWRQRRVVDQGRVRAFRGFNVYAEPFRRESEQHEKQDH